MKLFDYLNEIMWSKSELDFNDCEINKEYNIYIINSFLSMIEIYLPLINMVNMNPMPSKKDHYNFLRFSLPKQRHKIVYIKKTKEDDEETTKLIAEYYEVSIREAKLYKTLMKQDNINNIVNIYKDGKSDSKTDM
jgi:hypothetical protein